jgi:subtilisin family serine protease
MAPGVDIYAARCSCIGVTATDPFPNPVNPAWTVHYTALSGTSMATPHVTGAAALLFSGNPRLSPDQVMDLLINNATPHVDNYALYEAGHGYLNVIGAYEASRNTTGNLAAFLAGDQRFEINNVLGIDPSTAVYDSITHTGYVLAGATGVSPANTYAIEFEDDALFIEVDLTWTPEGTDAFDLEIVDSAGNLVVTSGNFLEQEAVLFIPTPGESYTARIVSFAAVNAAYELTINRAYSGN